MSNDAGSLAEGPYTYDPYGNGAPATGFPFKYTGRRLDPETGLYYYRARYYSSALGRFLQTDPIGYDDQMNLYAYVGNDPGNATDPSGRYLCEGTEEQCNRVRAYRERLDVEIGKLDKDSEEFKTLSAIASHLGTHGQKNGVTVKVANLPDGVYANAESATRINIDVGKIDKNDPAVYIKPAGMDDMTARNAYGAGILVHEGSHAKDFKEKLLDQTKDSMLQSELRAYRAQSYVERSAGLHTGLVHKDQSLEAYVVAITGAANGSVEIWCKISKKCN